MGVLSGGVINTRVQRSNERRRETELARAGARLVAIDLLSARDALERTGQDRVWDRNRSPVDVSVAVVLDLERWEAVARTILASEELAGTVSANSSLADLH